MTYSITHKFYEYKEVFLSRNKNHEKMANIVDQLAKNDHLKFHKLRKFKMSLKKLGTIHEQSLSNLNSNFISTVRTSQRKNSMSLQNFCNFFRFSELRNRLNFGKASE